MVMTQAVCINRKHHWCLQFLIIFFYQENNMHFLNLIIFMNSDVERKFNKKCMDWVLNLINLKSICKCKQITFVIKETTILPETSTKIKFAGYLSLSGSFYENCHSDKDSLTQSSDAFAAGIDCVRIWKNYTTKGSWR